MKNLLLKTKYLALVLLTACSFSCSTQDGEQGIAGQDGNANVIMKTVETVTWTSGDYLGISANVFEINDTDIDQNVLDKSMVLVYFQLSNGDVWYPMSYNFTYSDGTDEIITFTYSLNNLTIYSMESGAVLNAGISKVRYFIIDSSNNTAEKLNASNLSYDEVLNYSSN